MLIRLWSVLRALFRRPTSGAPPKPTEPEAAPAPSPSVTDDPGLAIASPSGGAEQSTAIPQHPLAHGEEDEDEWIGDDSEAADDEPDPFITGATTDPEIVSIDTQVLRAQARVEALSGEHRIYLSSPAGPGSLAEALNLLLGEGLVNAQFVETAEETPYILYRPVS